MIIGVVHLNWDRADRRIAVTKLPYKKPGFIIEEQFDARPAGSGSLDDRDFLVFDRCNWKTGTPVVESLFDPTGEQKIRIDSRTVQLSPGQQWKQPNGFVYGSDPAFAAVVCRCRISVLGMSNGCHVSGSHRIDFIRYLRVIGI